MRLTHWALAAALAAVLPGTAWAQWGATGGLRQPSSVRQTAYEYRDYYAQEPPATAKEEEPGGDEAPDQGQTGAANGYAAVGDDDDAADEPWSIMSLRPNGWLARNDVVIGGWTEIGYQNRPDGSFTGNGPFLTEPTGVPANGEWLRPNLNQQWLYAERIADGSKGPGLGFRADFLYGVDGNDAQSFGNRPGRWDYLSGFDKGVYNWAIPQLYGQVAFNEKLSVKVGHFFTPTGYEVIPPMGNFFFSRQMLWYNGEAFTHTGALGNYKVNETFTLIGGWFLGWDTGFNQIRGGNNGMAGFAWNPTEKTSIAYWSMFGNFGWRGQGFTNGVILSQKWTDRIMSVHQFDTLDTNNPTTFITNGITRNSIGTANYIFYELTEKLRLGARAEWMKMDGTSYYTFTYGVNIKPSRNLIIRPEMRYLWAPGVPNPNAPGTIAQNVFDVYGRSTVFGIDTVLTY